MHILALGLRGPRLGRVFDVVRDALPGGLGRPILVVEEVAQTIQLLELRSWRH
jgi:hypothetical protein